MMPWQLLRITAVRQRRWSTTGMHCSQHAAAAAARWHVMDADGYWRRQRRRHINTLNWQPSRITGAQPGLLGFQLATVGLGAGRLPARRRQSWFHRQLTVLGRRAWMWHNVWPTWVRCSFDGGVAGWTSRSVAITSRRHSCCLSWKRPWLARHDNHDHGQGWHENINDII